MAGIARALRFAHALYDGDTVFAAATGRRPLGDEAADFTEISALAADCIARAIARGVYEATALPFPIGPAGLAGPVRHGPGSHRLRTAPAGKASDRSTAARP